MAEATDLKDDIRTWLPGPFAMTGSVRWSVSAGTYRLALRIADPARLEADIRFANRLPIIRGWTILGSDVRLRG